MTNGSVLEQHTFVVYAPTSFFVFNIWRFSIIWIVFTHSFRANGRISCQADFFVHKLDSFINHEVDLMDAVR